MRLVTIDSKVRTRLSKAVCRHAFGELRGAFRTDDRRDSEWMATAFLKA
jgi:hypothetical protein